MQKYLIAVLPLASVALGNQIFNARGWEGNNFSIALNRTSDNASFIGLGSWCPDDDVTALSGMDFHPDIDAAEITEAQYASYAADLLFVVAVAPEIPQNIFRAFLLDHGLEIPVEEI
jgi:hypothetical protein